MVKITSQKKSGSIVELTSGKTIYTVYPCEVIRCINECVGFDENLLAAHIYRSEKKKYMQDIVNTHLKCFNIDLSEMHVLDFGAGLGASAVVLSRAGATKITSFDVIDNNTITCAKNRVKSIFPNIDHTYIIGEKVTNKNSRLPFDKNTFNFIFLNGVIEHVDPSERGHLFFELGRVLRSGGYIFISETPNSWFPYSSHTRVWLSEFLPIRMAYWYVQLLNPSKFPKNQSLDMVISRGLRGESIVKIEKSLGSKYSMMHNDCKENFDKRVIEITPMSNTSKIIRKVYFLSIGFFGKYIFGKSLAYFKSNIICVFQKNKQ
jgi:2-polyprenyl-3-methyl-5-hydroxy-6-metoxy-1,4-benzoquinol methylase